MQPADPAVKAGVAAAGLALLLALLLDPTSVQAQRGAQPSPARPSEEGPWPDPVAPEPPLGLETLALPNLNSGARVELERLPALIEFVGPPTVEAQQRLQHARQQMSILSVADPADAGRAEVDSARIATDAAGGETAAERSALAAAALALQLVYDWPGDVDAGPPVVEPAGDSDSVHFIGPRIIRPFELLGVSIAPGTRQRLFWNASQTYAGGDVRTPVDVVHGDREGPVLCLTAAIHGDELNGVEVVRQVMKTVTGEQLAGTVVAVPVVNLFGFSRNSRYLPDRRDLNRFFPGSPTGSIASRIAHSFFEQLARHCDAIVDMHTGSFDRINLPQVRADLRIPHVLEFTRGFGATPVLHSSGSRGMLRVAATQAGIPAVTFEVGGPGELQPPEIDEGVRALLTLLHKLGMVRDSPEWQEPQAIFYESRWVRANRGGMLISEVKLGERVQRGQRIGIVVDPLEDSEADVVASVSGRVIGMALNQVVLPGYAIYHLGEETSEIGAVSQAASGEAVLPYEEDAGRPATDLDEAMEPTEYPANDDYE
jgi:hypothetical protein